MFDNNKINEIKNKRKQWQTECLKPARDKHPERENLFTSSNVPIKSIYTPEDIQDADYMEKTGFPGEYPFTRGVHPTMHRGRLWTMRMVAGIGNAHETNKRLKYLLDLGETGINVVFDLPTHMGYDSDHPMADGEVGRLGVAIDSLEDMEALFDGIPIDKISVSLIETGNAAIIQALYIALVEKKKMAIETMTGSIQNDILREYVSRGVSFIFPPRPSVKLLTDIFVFCTEHMPKWNITTVAGYQHRDAGANAVQEVAFCFADAVAYIEAGILAGLDVDAFAPRIAFFFSAHNNIFEEVAKFRAARRIWAKIMKERFKSKNPKSQMLRFHTQTAGNSLVAQQPLNNIARVTLQALSSVLGGTQSLHTNAFDEALAIPSENSARIALRTQQIIAYESGAADVVDPLAGSYYVEWLTDRIEKDILTYLEKIERMGPTMLDAVINGIENGYFEQEIYVKEDLKNLKDIEDGTKIVVGLNTFKSDETSNIQVQKVNADFEELQKESLKKLKKNRNEINVKSALADVRKAAEKGENTIPFLVKASLAYATVGEMCDIFRDVYGVWNQSKIL
jgi:methylmalonyl-CoA mutase N-terminal domain/subunit